MKKQFKKAMSLFLAVLMLMTCWVWVAPTKAEAVVNQYYTFKVNFTVVNSAESGGNIKAWYYKFKDDGTGLDTSTSYEQVVVSSLDDGTTCSCCGSKFTDDAANVYHTLSYSVAGWPYKLQITMPNDVWYNGEIRIESMLIGDKNVLNGGTFTCTDNNTKTWEINPSTGTQSGDWGTATADWPLPKIVEVSSNPTSLSLVANQFGGGAVTDTVTYSAVDNYGVNWVRMPKGSHTITDAKGSTAGLTTSHIAASATSAGNPKTTVSVYPEIQALNPGAAGATYYLESTFGGVKNRIPVYVDHPFYTMSFNGNGGILDTSDAADIEGLVYGQEIAHVPSVGTKQGKQLVGFVYDSNSAVVTSDSQTLIDPSSTTTEDTWLTPKTKVDKTGNHTWYAVWALQDINATFKMPDGQTIATVRGKYSNHLTNAEEGREMYGSLEALNAAIKANCSNSTISFNYDNEPIWNVDGINYNFVGWRIVDAKDLEGKTITLNGDQDTVLQGDTVFEAVFEIADKKTYTITFYNALGSSISTKFDYNYKDVIVMPATQYLDSDVKYDYEHIGWAKNVGQNYYAVDAEGKEVGTGATISYVAIDTDSFLVRGDEEYVPVFRATPIDYNVIVQYKANNGKANAGTVSTPTVLNYDDAIVLPEGIPAEYTAGGHRYKLTGWNVKAGNKVIGTYPVSFDENGNVISDGLPTCVGNMTVVASYEDLGETTYKVTFLDRLGNPIEGFSDMDVAHGASIPVPVKNEDYNEVESDDDFEYTFKQWSLSADGSTRNNPGTGAMDATYYAIYTAREYIDVTYYVDGVEIYKINGKESDLVAGDVLPKWHEEKDPEKAEDVIGTYKFIGWLDGEGNEVVPGTTVTANDLYLNAQFETTYTDYTVEFVNANGEVISTETYNYGDPITVPEASMEADEKYTYEFRQWSPSVSLTCVGNATYTAVYNNKYIYYPVTWFQEGAVGVHHTSNYTYGERINTPATQPVFSQTAPANYTWVVDAWIKLGLTEEGAIVAYAPDGSVLEDAFSYGSINPAYLYNEEVEDANGNVIATYQRVDTTKICVYDRSHKATEEVYYYPTFKLSANAYNVTFYAEDGKTELGKWSVDYGTNLSDIDVEVPVKAAGTETVGDKTVEGHYNFDEWVSLADGSVVTTVSGDVAVKATYAFEEHFYDIDSIIKYPTCVETGWAVKTCSCGKSFEAELEVIPDDQAPDGKVTVDENSWTRNQFAGTVGSIDYNAPAYACPTDNLIITTKDVGTWSRPFNLVDPLITSRVNTIEYYVADEKIDDIATSNVTWTSRYNYDDVYAELVRDIMNFNSAITEDEAKKLATAQMENYEANATVKFVDLNLTDAEDYVIYVKMTDRVGNVSYMSTGTITYDATAPEFTVTGENGRGTTYCTEADIIWDATDDTIASVTLNDKEISDAETTEAGKYPVNVAGIHQAVVTDLAGNKTVKNFVINGSHKYKSVILGATCYEDGKTYDECSFCGDKINEKAVKTTGHSFVSYFSIAPTCVDDGYLVYSCSNGCGETRTYYPGNVTVPETEKELLATLKATGEHTYPTQNVLDEDGNPILVEGKTDEYVQEEAWVIDKEATCVEFGSKHRDCKVCGAREVVDIEKDRTEGHKYYRAKVAVEPTCTEDGWKNKTCKYCGYVYAHAETIPATGHTEGEYRIIKAAECGVVGEKILTCGVCGTDIGEKNEEGAFDITKTVEIPALEHVYSASGEPYQEGDKYYQLYVCDLCGAEDPREVDVEVLPEYTYTFYNEGTLVKNVTKLKGETISNADIENAAKDEDNTYRYTFKGWATLGSDGSYTMVEFPITVDADTILYAQYEAKYKNYTITYVKDDGKTQFKKVGYLHYGETYPVSEGPAKAADKDNSYEFAGWQAVDGTIYDKDIEIAGNITLTATYKSTPRVYKVTFAYDASNIIATVTVPAGADANNYYFYEEPTKASDSKYHYTFKDWDNESVEEVYSDIYTTPTFDKELHVFDQTVEVTPADCDNAQVVEKICSACDYSYETEGDPATEHVWAVVENEDGTTHEECQYCSSVNDETTYTVKFWLSASDITDSSVKKAYKTYSYNLSGSTLAAAPAAPTKAQSKSTVYTFSHWIINGDATGTKYKTEDITKFVIRKDVDFVAVFTEDARTYTVTYALDAYNILYTDVVEAGQASVYGGTEPTKASDSKYHYTFNGTWDNASLGEVYSDIYTTPNFDKAEHTFTKKEAVAATCETNRVDRMTCTCNYYYDVEAAGTALGHDWGDAYTDETTGESIQECQRADCDAKTTNTQNYTVRFWRDVNDTRAYRSSSFNKWGTKVVAPAAPEKEATNAVEYTFSHWTLKGDASGAEVDVDSYLIKEDTDFLAVYTTAPLTYTVTYALDGGVILATDTVTAGSASAYTGSTPTKAADSKNHYTFKAWDSAALGAVYNDIYTKPVFNAVAHSFTEGEVVTAATCDNDAVVKMVCSCNYSYEVTKTGTATGHNWGAPYKGEDGKWYKKCQNANCDTTGGLEVEDTETTFDVIFYLEDGTTQYKKYTFNVIGKPVSTIPTNPTKAATVYKTYTFSHWYLKGDATKTAVDLTTYAITADTEFVAAFTDADITYKVTYKSGSTVLQETTVAAGGTVTYTGTTPVKAYDDNGHYTFAGWSSKAENVTSDITINAKFNKIAHENNETVTDATCTEGEYTVYSCSCGYVSDPVLTAPNNGHKWKEAQRVEATPEKNGYIIYKCTVAGCDGTKETELVWQEGSTDTDTKSTITVVVTANGAKVNGAKVELYQNGTRLGDAEFTSASGIATFTVEDGDYIVLVSGVGSAYDFQQNVRVKGADVSVDAKMSMYNCACACHRNNLWGTIFRFFHQIIKWITGEFKCCKDPSELYNK